MKKLKRFTTRLLSLTLAAVMSLCAVGGSAFATVINYEWAVGWFGDGQENLAGWPGNGSTIFSVDSKVHTDNSPYSIKIENTDYNISYVERTYKVEPYTTYRFSAMVKYSGYALSPDAETQKSGACVGKAYSYDNSGYTTSSGWTFMEYEFTTGNETTCNLALQNGIYNGMCKGTAWFSDVKLEKAVMTNKWNILAVFFKNVDATVNLNGKTVHHKMSLRESDIDGMNKYALDTLPDNLKALSNNKMTVNSIDRYYTDEVLTEKDLAAYENGYCVNEYTSPLLSKTLDKYLAQKHYNQIIIFVPFDGINGDWWGLGGTEYKGVHFAQITNSWDGAFETNDRFKGEVTVHEICHCLESDSKTLSPEKTPSFHSVIYDYPDPKVDLYERIHMFMTATLPGGKGLDPSVFNVTSGKYTFVSDDMTTGKGIEPGSSSVKLSAPKNLKAESVGDDTVKITWSAVPKASGYQAAIFKDAGFKEIWNIFDYKSDRTATNLSPITKGKPYYYAVRTVYSANGTVVYSDWTTIAYTHVGVGVVSGDVDNNGKFNLDDVYAALQLYVNDTVVDKRTLNVIGATKGYISLDDVLRLLNQYLIS